MPRSPETAKASAKAPNAAKAPKAAKPPAPWCKRLFAAEAQEIWSWFSALGSSSLPRRSVNDLWRRPSRNVPSRQLFADNEMRRRILGIKKGDYVCLSPSTVTRILEGWKAARRKQPREAAPEAAAVEREDAEDEDAEDEDAEDDAEDEDAEDDAEDEDAEDDAEEPVEPVELDGERVEAAALDPALVAERLAAAVAAKEMHKLVAQRLGELHTLFEAGRAAGVLRYEIAGPGAPQPSACILGWSKMVVSEPLAVNAKVREMVEKDKEDQLGVWSTKINGQPLAHTDSTWETYALLREIGCKPRFRGPANLDPGQTDMMYYREWTFNADAAFEAGRLSMAKRAQGQSGAAESGAAESGAAASGVA